LRDEHNGTQGVWLSIYISHPIIQCHIIFYIDLYFEINLNVKQILHMKYFVLNQT